MLQCLLEAKANPDAKDNDGKLALDYANCEEMNYIEDASEKPIPKKPSVQKPLAKGEVLSDCGAFTLRKVRARKFSASLLHSWMVTE